MSAIPSDSPAPNAYLRFCQQAQPYFSGLLLLAVVICYCNSFAGEFVFDDTRHIVENKTIHSWDNWQAMLGKHRPLVELTLALNYALEGPNVVGYHLFNVALHALSALLLFRLLKRLLCLPQFQACAGKSANFLAFIIALLWAVHPVNTQAVTYIIQRGESMMSLFYLATLYFSLRAMTSGKRQHSLWIALAGIACCLGMLSKEAMVTAPAAVYLMDVVFVSRSWVKPFKSKPALYVLLCASWGLLAYTLGGGADLLNDNSAGFNIQGPSTTPWQYLYSQSQVLVHYLSLTVWPYYQRLIFDYEWRPARSVWEVWPHGMAMVSLLLVSVYFLLRKHWLGFVGCFFFLMLAPTSSFMPILDLAVEHRLYLPVISIIVLGVLAAYALLQRIHLTSLRQGLATVGMLCALLFLGGNTLVRNSAYRSGITLWQTVLERNPTSLRAHGVMGSLLNEIDQPAQALPYATYIIDRVPEHPSAYLVRGQSYMKLNQLDLALKDYETAIRLDPTMPIAHYNRGSILMRLGQRDQAIASFRQAIKHNPQYVNAHNNLAASLIQAGHFDEAGQLYAKAIALDPNHSDVRWNFGSYLMAQGQPAQAMKHFLKYVSLEPHAPPHRVYAIAKLLASHPDPKVRDLAKAAAFTQTLLDARPSTASGPSSSPLPDFILLDLLAMVHASLQHYPQAITTQQQALTLANKHNMPSATLKHLEKRLHLYQQSKPYRLAYKPSLKRLQQQLNGPRPPDP